MNAQSAGTANASNSSGMDAGLIAFAVVVATLAVVFFVLRFWSYPIGPPESWGQFGDYLGGIVNPAVGVVTAFLVARTLAATRREAADTREEMKHQTTQLREQLETSRSELAAADVRRQLEAILEEWRRRILTMKYSGPIGHEVSGTARSGNNSTLEELFEDKNLAHQIAAARNSKVPAYYARYWIEHFTVAAQLVEEMAISCERYDSLMGTHAYTDFYRHRVAGAVAALSAAGFVTESAEMILRIAPLGRSPQIVGVGSL